VRLAAFAATFLAAATASANGRFPAANQLVVDRDDAAHIVVRTTFGIVATTDAGKTWRFVCEEKIGFSGTYDPAIAIAGSVLATLPDGLARSADRGCSFARVGEKRPMVDLASDGARVVAVGPGLVATSIDRGLTFNAVFTLESDLEPATIDLAASRPDRWYLSGVGPFKQFGSVFRSDDAGKTFTESTFDMRGARMPYIAAVDPRDADVVWLRLDGDTQDGARVAVGGPSDGLWTASTNDLVFTRVSDVRVRCLTWTAAGLWACGDDAADGFTVGLSRDEGRTFAPQLRLSQLEPLACTRPACDAAWSALAPLIQPRDAGADAEVPAIDAPRASGGGCSLSGESPSFAWLLLLSAAIGRSRAGSR
jgi:hypothetical protein